jgi:Tfp pilus assembly protein PilF
LRVLNRRFQESPIVENLHREFCRNGVLNPANPATPDRLNALTPTARLSILHRMQPATLTVKLADLMLDPVHPGAAADMPADQVLDRLRAAYGFLAANTDFAIHGDSVVITFDPANDEQITRVQADFDKAVKQVSAGRINKAVELFRRVLAVVSAHPEARRNLAMALMASRRFAEAKDELVDILRLDPVNPWALMLMGTIFAKHEGNSAVAETYYQKAHRLAPQDAYVLTNYAALKVEQGSTADAQALFEQAIAADPRVPNPYYGLATLFSASDRTADAWQQLEAMFSTATFTDPRSLEILEESRRLYLHLAAQVADLQSEQAMQWVVQYRERVAGDLGTAIELLSDDSLGSTSAKAAYDWERQGLGHCIRFNPAAPSIVPALVLREIERIRLKHRARADGISEAVLKPTGNPLNDSLLEFALLAPEQSRIDSGLRDVGGEIQPALFVEAYLRADEQFRAYESMKTRRAASADCLQVFELAAAATAYHLDSLFEPKTAYGPRYAKSGSAPRARELAEDWHRQEDDFADQRDRFISETHLSKHVMFQPPEN